MTFAPGALVRARGRDWVVLPDSSPDLLVVRPLGGTDDEVAGLLTSVEDVAPAEFAAPDPADAGNAVSAGLLRTALQIGFRSTAGPFRSVASLAVEPRPYQLVPLLMALRQRTTRLLIADDVGVGKTVEAGLVATELLAQGSARGLAVLCAPALAEQWQAELAAKFHLDAELVLSSTVGRLSRELLDDQSIFERHPYTVVSTDLIKSPRHRDDFARACPDLVVVDEAHTCVADGTGGGARSLRYDLLRRLAADPRRHLLLVTATPHSGKDEGFRNLIGLLDPVLSTVNLGTVAGRERLARHMVQRRRGDIRRYLDESTPFPDARMSQERSYHLGPEYAALLRDVVRYAQEVVRDEAGGAVRQRVRYWSVLALLRALASSPRAAAATLRTRARTVAAHSSEEADALGRASVLDLDDGEAAESVDVPPGADDTDGTGPEHRRLLAFARRAEALVGKPDAKMVLLGDIVAQQLLDGFTPVVFCRFIDTAEYVTEQLRARLGKEVTVATVTGLLPPAEREVRIAALTDTPGRRVLVATDCLSEGVNLQEHFQAVIHYDLAWNPTRHEQREGRVDRFGQRFETVRAVTIVGADNRIDEIVMRVLLRKHDEIRRQLGISVPVPNSANQVVEAVLDELLSSPAAVPDPDQGALFALDELAPAARSALHEEWDSSATAERESRTKFAQAGIRPTEVARELAEMRAGLGTDADVEAFVREAVDALGAPVSARDDGFTALTASLPAGLRDALPPGHAEPLPFHVELPVPRGHAHLDRTDAAVTAVARHVLDTALDPLAPGPRPARRCGVMRTAAVTRRTTLLLVRFRMNLALPVGSGLRNLVAEDAALFGFRGRPDSPEILDDAEVRALTTAVPAGNVERELAADDLRRAVERLPQLQPLLTQEANRRAERLREAHARVRDAGRQAGSTRIQVTPHLPADVLGLYVYLPAVVR